MLLQCAPHTSRWLPAAWSRLPIPARQRCSCCSTLADTHSDPELQVAAEEAGQPLDSPTPTPQQILLQRPDPAARRQAKAASVYLSELRIRCDKLPQVLGDRLLVSKQAALGAGTLLWWQSRRSTSSQACAPSVAKAAQAKVSLSEPWAMPLACRSLLTGRALPATPLCRPPSPWTLPGRSRASCKGTAAPAGRLRVLRRAFTCSNASENFCSRWAWHSRLAPRLPCGGRWTWPQASLETGAGQLPRSDSARPLSSS